MVRIYNVELFQSERVFRIIYGTNVIVDFGNGKLVYKAFVMIKFVVS